MKIKKELSRKQARKQKKVQKKQRVQAYHFSKSKSPQVSIPHPIIKKNIHQANQTKSKMKLAQRKDSYIDQHYNQQARSQEKTIALLQKKLKIKSNSKNYGKLAKKMGFDDDLFKFLDNISSKVRNKNSNQDYQIDQQDGQDFNDPEGQDFSSYEEEDQEILQDQKEKEEKKKVQQVNKIKQIQQPVAEKNNEAGENSIDLQKKMNSLFNKLSDGNLLYTFREFISIFESTSKSTAVQIFSNLFVKFNLLIEKPLVHVLTANIVMSVGLHRVYGDRLMAQILYQLTQRFLCLYREEEDREEIEQIGYSKLFEKKKNYITIISYLYEFNSISSNFPRSMVEYLMENSSDKQNIELIYQIIQKCGVKMRNNDPGTLKEVIDILKSMIEESKKNGTYELTKIKFIDIQINEIRFNKKGLFNADQRMGFLHTFLNKNVKQQGFTEQITLDTTFFQFKAAKDTSKTSWWIEEGTFNPEGQNNQLIKQKMRNSQTSKEVKQLIQLAKSLQFVTEVKRNIFVQLMSSQDYIEATRRIIDLKNRRLEDISTVLVEVNLQESAFNPFYVLVASKICEQIPKFRVCLQFSVWDRLKQVHQFEPRRISNLGKFCGWLISSQSANCSLSMLKYFPDLLNTKSQQDVFLRVFFKELLKKSSKKWIIKLSQKLKQEKNKGMRDGIKDYLSQMLEQMQMGKERTHAVLLRKSLVLQLENEMDRDQ